MRARRRRMRNRMVAGLAAAGGLALLGMGVRALVRRLAVRRQRGLATTADAAFVMAAVDHHVQTIALGEAAGVRADHVEVRDFAQLLAEQHTQALTDLQEVAGYLGIGLQTSPSAKVKRQVSRLQGETGIAVDRTFVRHVLDHHARIIPLFEEAIHSAVSPEVSAYAQAHLPHLRAHERVAEDLGRHMAEVAAR